MSFFLKSSNEGAPDSTVTVVIDGQNNSAGPPGMGGQATRHMFSIDPADSTVGTITVTAKAYGGVVNETVFESDGVTPVSIDLSDSNKSFTRALVGYSLESVSFASSGMDGSNNWIATVSSGD